MLKYKEEYTQKNKQHRDPKVAAIEKKSGLSLQDVHIHYDSSKPYQFHAHAYTSVSYTHLSFSFTIVTNLSL